MGGYKAPITTFIVEPFVPYDQEYYLSIVSEGLTSTISLECGGIEIEENRYKVKIIFMLLDAQTFISTALIGLHSVLTVGLGNCVYLWNACSSKVTSFVIWGWMTMFVLWVGRNVGLTYQ